MAHWLLTDGATATGPTDLRVRDGHVVEVGRALSASDDEVVVPLAGRTVVPGLRDAHVHATTWAIERRRAALNRALVAAGSPSEAADAVAAAVRATGQRRPVLRGTGFRPSAWDDAPTSGLLDRASGDAAVVLSSQDLHSSWWSSAALRLVGLDHPTGFLREHESWDALSALPEPSADEVDTAVAEALHHAISRGVTTIVDYEIDGCLHAWSQRAARHGGGLPLHVVGGVTLAGLDAALSAEARTGEVLTPGAAAGVGTTAPGSLRVGALKLFSDGALGSRTAWCDHHYVAEPGNTGRRLLGLEELVATLRRADRGGLRTTVHAIGDAANRMVLDAFEAAGVPGRIEHAQLLDPADVPRFAALGVTASLQPAHATDDRDLAERWWADRLDRAYPLASLVAAGTEVVLGSDAPVTAMDPWRTIAAATARTVDDLPPWRPEQAVPYDVALDASTATRLEAGAVADLCILDADPAGLSPADLAAIPVWATLVAGVPVHDAEHGFAEASA